MKSPLFLGCTVYILCIELLNMCACVGYGVHLCVCVFVCVCMCVCVIVYTAKHIHCIRRSGTQTGLTDKKKRPLDLKGEWRNYIADDVALLRKVAYLSTQWYTKGGLIHTLILIQ